MAVSLPEAQRRLREHLASSDVEIERFVATLTAFLRQNLTRILSDVSVDDQARAYGTLRDLLPSMRAAGLADEAARVERLYGSELSFTGGLVAASAATDVVLTAADADIIDLLISFDVDAIESRITDYVVDIRAQVMRGVIGGLAPDFDAIFDESLPRLEQVLKTEIDTAKQTFNRSVAIKKSADAGLDYFLYYGPNDKVTRPFCRERVGKVFHRSELERWDNGQGLPAATSLGGYNCRHSLLFMTEEEARRNGYTG